MKRKRPAGERRGRSVLGAPRGVGLAAVLHFRGQCPLNSRIKNSNGTREGEGATARRVPVVFLTWFNITTGRSLAVEKSGEIRSSRPHTSNILRVHARMRMCW